MKIGIPTVLFLIFLVLKLAEIGQVAQWSWWWVTSPLWIVWGLVFGLLMLASVLNGIGSWLDVRRMMREK